MAKAVDTSSSDSPVSQWQAPLSLRVIECPSCKRKHLVSNDHLSRHARCVCKKRLLAAEYVVTDEAASIADCYTQWTCPKCDRALLVPRLAVVLPATCPCGQEYPTASQAGVNRYQLDELTDAFVGNDPLLSENMLVPLRAAQRYDYEVAAEGNDRFRVRNPKKGTTYTVSLSQDFVDECNCEVFQAGSGTCIHIEHARIKQGLPSTAQALAESQEFAYAWLDKAALPARIRIGWLGNIERKVRTLIRRHGAITSQSDLDSLSSEFEKAGISFRSLSSAKLALTGGRAVNIDSKLAEQISLRGRAFLAKHIPQLHQFQVEGSLFLATAQRALLLDEMGLGKTVQAIAAACILKEFANVSSCLILAPKSVLRHWQTESVCFSGMECTLIEGPPGVRTELYGSKSFFKATTLESFRQDFPDVGQHELIVVDEIHKARNIKTVSNRVLREVKSRFLFGLSGTAIESSLEDLFGLLRIIRSPDLELPLHFYASHIVCDEFGKTRYTVHPEFFFVRHADRVLRRCKSETETEIPKLNIEHVELPLADLQQSMADPLLTELEELKDRLKRRYEHNDFIRHRWLVNRIVELSNSTELLDPKTDASSKLEWLEGFLKSQCVDAEEKVVVFTRWVRSQEMILRVCEKLGISAVSLNGQDAAEERQRAVRNFTQDGSVRVFVSTDAGGVGVNLQAARLIVNFEPAWNPSTDAQRIQRVHRIGQRREVRAILPMTLLDYWFTFNTHPRKSFAADRIDAARQATTGEAIQSWEELVPVIDRLRPKIEGYRRQ